MKGGEKLVAVVYRLKSGRLILGRGVDGGACLMQARVLLLGGIVA